MLGSYGIVSWRDRRKGIFRVKRTRTEQEHYETLLELLFDPDIELVSNTAVGSPNENDSWRPPPC